jgi:hypothetical protein
VRVEALGASLLGYFSVNAEAPKAAGVVAAVGDEELEDAPLIGAGGTLFCATLEPRSAIRIGDSVEVTLDVARLHFFEPRDRPAGIRPRRHPLRSGEQLWPAVRLGRGELRTHVSGRPRARPRRADHLHEGRLRHVAGAVRRSRLAQVPARAPRPEPASPGTGLRRHLLFARLRSRDAARGDHWARSTPRSGAERRSTPASPRTPRRRLARRRRSCFTDDELEIDRYATESSINISAESSRV